MKSLLQTVWILLGLALVLTALEMAGCSRSGGSSDASNTLYTCGMHPQVIKDHPGNCPICGMRLTPIRHQAGPSAAGQSQGHISYYKSTMMPGETSPKPAKDSMGMDMVPVYDTPSAGASDTTLSVDPATIQNMNIQTTVVKRGPLRRIIRTVGTIDYNETTLVDVTTKFKGWIETLNVDATGQLVHRGEPLFSIYSPDLYSAEVEYLLALNQPASNDAGADTLRETAASKLRFYDISDAQIAELEKTREAHKTLQIQAPADGFVTEKMIVRGQMVDAGMKLYQLADLAIVWVYAEIYEQDLSFIQLGQEAVVRLPSMPDREFRGRVTYVYPNVDVKTRTARVRMEFENPGYFLKPGMFVSVQIASEIDPSVLLIPDSAILRSGEKNTVFVALPGGKFDPRTIVPGPESEAGNCQVLEGLAEGDRVVTSGQFMLDSESQLNEAILKMKSPGDRVSPAPPPEGPAPATLTASSNAPIEGVVYVCPMPAHVSITYDHPGKCPICGMGLVPVTPAEVKRLQPGGTVLYYTCPMPEHASVHEDKPGKCPICGMTLIPVMSPPPVAAAGKASNPTHPSTLYTCSMHPEAVSDKPGQCPVCGMNLVPTTTVPDGKISEEIWRKQHEADLNKP